MSAPQLALAEETSAQGIESLRDEWSDLWYRVPDATPFQTPEWTLGWWKEFGEGDPLVLTLRSGEQLSGIVPLCIQPADASGNRRAMLMGTGITDYLDPLLSPSVAAVAAQQVLQHLSDGGSRWQRCDLEQLRPSSALLAVGAPLAAHDWRVPQEVCPVLTLPRTCREFGECIPQKFLQRLAYSGRRLKREGRVTLQQATVENADDMFDSLLHLHGARWGARGEPGVLASDGVARFHRGIMRPMLRRGALRLYSLQLDGETVAAYYGFMCSGHACYYLGGFHPQLERLSVGSVMVEHAVTRAVEEGATEFDFLRGSERYKYRWGARDRTNYRRTLSATAMPSSLRATEAVA